MVAKAINSILAQKSTVIGVLQENIEEVLRQENSPTKDVDGKLEELQKRLLQEKYGFKVHTAYIAEAKRSLGLPMYYAPNVVEKLKHPTKEKVKYILIRIFC